MKNCKDHLGNVYKSIKDMCDFYSISTNTYRNRINNLGWSLEKALTEPLTYACEDHLGNKYTSERDMCKAYQIDYGAFWTRTRDMGWSLEKALTTPTRDDSCLDHLGNRYDSVSKMCAAYNIAKSCYKKRIINGWSIKDALTIPSGNRNPSNKLWTLKGSPASKSCKDHKGNDYPSFTAMCKAYDMPKSTVEARINKHGWSLEDALTIPVNMSSEQYITCEDHLGNHYINLKQMCDTYGKDCMLVYSRRNRGWTIQEALLIPRNMYIGEYRVAECLKRLNVKFYHDCTIKTIFADLGISIDWTDFLSELQSKLGSIGYDWSKKKIQRLRPDFILYTDEDNKIRGVIEFDGEQHQNYIEFFFKTIEEFYKRSNIDFVKQSLWEYMNIPMLRIRHDQIDMIDNMVQDFINKPQDYIHNHNTYLSEEEYWSILTEQKRQIELAFAS